jgi:hypothetical protein
MYNGLVRTACALVMAGVFSPLPRGGPYALGNGSYQVRLPLLNLLHKQFFRLRHNGS